MPRNSGLCCEVQGCGVLYTATGIARRLWRHSDGHSQAAVLQWYKAQINRSYDIQTYIVNTIHISHPTDYYLPQYWVGPIVKRSMETIRIAAQEQNYR
jgi:hypothetical protein